MKKLLTFAGVSALALVTAAPNAFAAEQGTGSNAVVYGTYNPTCTAITGALTVNFYGYTSSGAFGLVKTTTVSAGSSGTYDWSTSVTLAQLMTPVGGTSGITVNGTKYSKGLTPRGAVLYSLGNEAPTADVYNANNKGMLVTKTTSTWNPAKMINASDPTGLAGTLSFGFKTGAQFPSITSAIWNQISTKANILVANYILSYAATCIDPSNGDCTLHIGSTNGTNSFPGVAVYSNSCDSGYTGTNFGDDSLVCTDTCASVATAVNQSATASSTTPNYN